MLRVMVLKIEHTLEAPGLVEPRVLGPPHRRVFDSVGLHEA